MSEELEQSNKRKGKPSSFAILKRGESDDDDATTGATPGVSSACKDLGLEDMSKVLKDRGIKPPGVS